MTKKITSNDLFGLTTVILLLLQHGPVLAEYRAYQYYVKSKTPLVQDVNAYLSTSTLDPVSYISYHGGNEAIEIDILRTWICPGYTGLGKNICKGPYERILELKMKAQEELARAKAKAEAPKGP